jgi:hypothetical protein
MRGHVRVVVPPPDDGTLEVLVGVGPTGEDGTCAEIAAREPPALPRPSLLGPNGDLVADLLGRASAMSAAEARALNAEASWRWTLPTPVPVAGGFAVARAVAVLRGRKAGRGDAIRTLETAVAKLASGPAWHRRRLGATAVAAAGLAVLARDLLDPDQFEILFRPWQTVMHH